MIPIRTYFLMLAASKVCVTAFSSSRRCYHAVAPHSRMQRAPIRATSSNDDLTSSFAGRRQWLQAAGTAVIAAVVPAAPASASPSFVSSVQGPVQDAIAPGHWIGQFIGINSKTETWDFPRNKPAEVSAALVEVLDDLTPDRRVKLLIPEFEVARADATAVHVRTWTKAEWLDALDVKFADETESGCVATASFYATGFFPTIVPLAPILNVAMSWFPFASPGPRGEALQDFRLRAIKGLLAKKLDERGGELLG